MSRLLSNLESRGFVSNEYRFSLAEITKKFELKKQIQPQEEIWIDLPPNNEIKTHQGIFFQLTLLCIENKLILRPELQCVIANA